MFRSLVKPLISLAFLLGTATSHSAIITSSSDTLLDGASVITFSEVAVGTFDPSINGVSFTGVGGNLTTIASAFNGQTSPILGNSAVPPFSSGNGISFDIVFGTAVSAFSLDLAAINGNATSLNAYDGSNILLGSVGVPEFISPAQTWGLGGFGASIARVRVTANDFFFTDNLRYVAATSQVPEPGTLALVGLALAGLGLRRRSRK